MVAAVLELLRSPALTLWGVDVAWSEVAGDLTGAACVWLVARQHVANWPLGLANNLFWALLFVDAKLYGDAVLQGVFFALGVYGWWLWVRGDGGGEPLRVRGTAAREWGVLATATALSTVLAHHWLDRWTDSPVPLWDATVLTLSLLATWGQANKRIESWWVWIAVDVISVPLYVSRGLYPTAALYVVFGALCVVGLRDWSRARAAEVPA
ncbi:MAG: nicotinamide riboside transporter PnuC [Myxococcota bacterium]